MLIVTLPFECIRVDLVGLLTKSSQRHTYIMVVIDYATMLSQGHALVQYVSQNSGQRIATHFSWVGFPKQPGSL